MSPARKRTAIKRVQKKLDVSERRACKVIGQPRSTQRYSPRRPKDEERLVKRMTELAMENPRRGYRMVWARLRQEGWKVNRKRIYRLWRKEGLKVQRKTHKKRRLGNSRNGCKRLRAEHKDHVWAWDFIHDYTSRGGQLKCLSIVDEYTRECLSLEVARSITSEDVQDELIRLFMVRDVPKHIRSDNGPEFIAKTLQSWLKRSEAKTLYIKPGAPWENGYAESFHSRLRDEFFNVEEFRDVREARALAHEWQREYNHEGPHSSLGYKTPAEFAQPPHVPPGVGSLPLPEHAAGKVESSLITTGT